MQRDSLGLMENPPILPTQGSNINNNNHLEDICKSKYPVFITPCVQSCQFSEKTGSLSIESCVSTCKIKIHEAGCLAGCQSLAKASKNALGYCPDSSGTTSSMSSDPSSDQASNAGVSDAVISKLDRECHLDEQCTTTGGTVRKCCQQKCIIPKFHPDVGPSLWPPTIMEGSDGLSFEMTWKVEASVQFPSKSALSPVLFVLQVRTHFNPDFEPDKASRWKTLLVTFREGVRLQDLQPGMWYQFRVASVTKMGTRGFHTPSPPVRLSRLPRPPSLPRNVTDGAWRIRSNGKININIKWLAPVTMDIPITEYKISWVRDHGFIQPDGQSLESLTDFIQSVPGAQRSYNIEGLVADKTYKVQIQAICKWGSNVLASNPSTIFLTTPSLPQKNNNQLFTSDNVGVDSDICICQNNPRDIYNQPQIKISKPFLQKNSLKVNLQILNYNSRYAYRVSYSPRVCIDSDYIPLSPSQSIYAERSLTTGLPNVTLGPLHFSCRYHITIQPLRFRKWQQKPLQRSASPFVQYPAFQDPAYQISSNPISSCFCTPSCISFVKQTSSNTQNLKCISEDSIKSDQRGSTKDISKLDLNPPSGLYFQRSQKNPRSFLVFWKQNPESLKSTSSDQSNNYIIRYRVIWGPSIDDLTNLDLSNDKSLINAQEDVLGLVPRLDLSKAETKVLRQNVSSIWLDNLQPNTFYIVQVQSILMHHPPQFSQMSVSIPSSSFERASDSKILILSTHDKSPTANINYPEINLFSSRKNHSSSIIISQQYCKLLILLTTILHFIFVIS